MNKHIISFDPGISTGIVVAKNIDYIQRSFEITAKGILMFDNRATILAMLTKYKDTLEAIIVEDFMLFPSKASAQSYSRFETVKVIERITVYAEQLEIAHLIVMQKPAQRKSANGFPIEHQTALGHNRHLYAAYQHLRFYVFMHKVNKHSE